MNGINKAIILGNLTRDPEIRYIPNGSAVANFSVATNESWKDKSTGQNQERAEFHNITIFGKLAEICGEYLRKGSQVYLEGKITTEKYQDKQTGQDRYSTKIVCNEMQMLGGKPQGQQQQQGRSQPQQAQQPHPNQTGGFAQPQPNHQPQGTPQYGQNGPQQGFTPQQPPKPDFDDSDPIPF